ncbi:hypothetical protein IM816_11675 [Luteibacter flocculans]|uniref:Halovibrin HvnA n=1 Tax=Luteibacter flocculans TaxID=2780091 RepID=A0ABY4SZQ2_9GAMM|nr:hypothetical protein [Luteibacter flocculans]URL57297.1 hypothetical protein IM816_11675 [Luteibacter flocculans]
MKARLMYAWRSLGVAVAVVLLAACAGQGYRPHGSYGRASGAEVARHLQERYDETFRACMQYPGDPDPKPVLLCSGVLMRATRRGVGYYVWNPNPGSPVKQGVSFSWLRRDAGFSSLAFSYTNGFIILPRYYADSPSDGYTQLFALCAYPYDAATVGRTTGKLDGCGAYVGIADSGPCEAQGIQNSAAWIAQFGHRNFYGEQCGFGLLPGTPNATQAFESIGQIRSQLNKRFDLQNEIMIGAWAQDDARIPLEAFFYLAGSAPGLSEARQNQSEFKSVTNRWAPIIQVTLPSALGGAASFRFNTQDQQVPQP